MIILYILAVLLDFMAIINNNLTIFLTIFWKNIEHKLVTIEKDLSD